MGLIPRAAVALRPENEALSLNLSVGVLEMTSGLLKRLAVRCEQLHNTWLSDNSIRRLVWCEKAITLHTLALYAWIDGFGSWGREWHSKLRSDGVVLLPARYALGSPRECKDMIVEFEACWLPLQAPYVRWCFRPDPLNVIEISTTPLPLAAFREISEQEVEWVSEEEEVISV